MKKIYHLILFSLLAISAWGYSPSNLAMPVDSFCSVAIGIDSTNTGDVILVAYATGEAPFAYNWSTNENTQSIVVTSWGVNYCVTVTDATGCEATSCLFNQNTCSSYIDSNPAGGLTAVADGNAPFSYVWNTGSTESSISPNAPGNYCVSVTDATGCYSVACYWWGNQPDSCSVFVSVDSANTGIIFTANANGVAPFSYSWSTGATTQSVPLNPNYFGPYCVSVTDATGCVSYNCATFNPCSVHIEYADSVGFNTLVAVGNTWGNASYTWSTGETSQYIVVTDPGLYCVTVTGNGCVSSDCYNFTIPNNFDISGYLYLPDSLNGPANLQGTVELFFNDLNSNAWVSLGTTNIESDPSGWSSYYTFGTQTNAGEYIVKATLDPNMPIAGDYMPTYHFSTVHWDEADLINLPSVGSGLYNIIFNDGTNLLGSGSGNINGTVTEGDGFSANGEGDRSGAPRPNTSVLLFDADGQAITHTLTDALGQYSFNGLPFGTYKIEVEIVGVEQVERWVTLSGSQPTSSGNDFQVTTDGIVLSIHDVVDAASIRAFPNPTNSSVSLSFNAAANFDAKLSLSRADGKLVHTENQRIVKGSQQINLDLSNYPAGLYLLQMTTDSGVLTTKLVKE